MIIKTGAVLIAASIVAGLLPLPSTAFAAHGDTSDWDLVLEVVDNGTLGAPITNAGLAGLLSDFMDISVFHYRVGDGGAGEPPEYGLSTDRTVEESSNVNVTSDANWWLGSGAYFTVEDNSGNSVMGELPEDDPWQALYAESSPEATDGGFHPQNIFRLFTTASFDSFAQSAYIIPRAYHASESESRGGHNGVMFFIRSDSEGNGDTYFAGVRADGKAIIKKRVGGGFFTLGTATVFDGAYNRDTNPNLIPLNVPLGIKTEVLTAENGDVTVRLFLDIAGGEPSPTPTPTPTPTSTPTPEPTATPTPAPTPEPLPAPAGTTGGGPLLPATADYFGSVGLGGLPAGIGGGEEAELGVTPGIPDTGAVLGAQTPPGEEAASCENYLFGYISPNADNDPAEVVKLQRFLNAFGYGSLDENGAYDSTTEIAVRRFQSDFWTQILLPWGLTDPTGFVYVTTSRWINIMQCPHLIIPMPELI